MKYAWMQQQTEYNVSRMCRLLAGLTQWLLRVAPPPAQRSRGSRPSSCRTKSQCCFAQGRGTYGTRRIKYLLAQEGLVVSRRRMGRLLTQAGLRCKTRRKFKAPDGCGAGPDGRPKPAPSGVSRASTKYRVRRGYSLPAYR